MDVVYLVRPGDDNEELRHSLRSIAAHLPHGRVWLAGHCPRWVRGVGRIPVGQADGSKWKNARRNLRAACAHPEVSDPFALFNDDFFAVEPVAEVPVWHQGLASEWLAAHPWGSYRYGLLETVMALEDAGVADALAYNLHVPMPVRKGAMLAALDEAEDAMGGDGVIHVRTYYGNRHGIGGEHRADVKVRTFGGFESPTGPWLSTDDGPFSRGQVGAHIRAAFPDACRYEE